MPDAIGDGGIRIRYDDAGHGEPAYLCLAGWCVDRSHFQAVGRRLVRRHRVLCPDWRGHGESAAVTEEFGLDELVLDALAVIEHSGAEQVVPVAASHAGWVALELRRRLGPRVPKLVLVDWMVLGLTPAFRDLLREIADPTTCRAALPRLFERWLPPGSSEATEELVRGRMARQPDSLWARAARAIEAAYAREHSPLSALARLAPAPPTLHVYATPKDEAVLMAQQLFARERPFFEVRRLESVTHFPAVDAPTMLGAAIERFVG